MSRNEQREDDVVAELRIRVRRDGAMSVAGCIQEEAYALAMLEHAKDTIRQYSARQRINKGDVLMTPSYDAPRIAS